MVSRPSGLIVPESFGEDEVSYVPFSVNADGSATDAAGGIQLQDAKLGRDTVFSGVTRLKFEGVGIVASPASSQVIVDTTTGIATFGGSFIRNISTSGGTFNQYTRGAGTTGINYRAGWPAMARFFGTFTTGAVAPVSTNFIGSWDSTGSQGLPLLDTIFLVRSNLGNIYQVTLAATTGAGNFDRVMAINESVTFATWMAVNPMTTLLT